MAYEKGSKIRYQTYCLADLFRKKKLLGSIFESWVLLKK